MIKYNQRRLLKRQKEHKKQFHFRPVRKLNQYQTNHLKHHPYKLDGSVIYFSTWDTSDFIVFRGTKALFYFDENYCQHVGSPMFMIRWNRTTTQKSGICTIALVNNVLKLCKNHIENPVSFFEDFDDEDFTDTERKLLIKCMKQYVECETNPIALEEARKKVFLDR